MAYVDVFSVFCTTTELIERISNLWLPYDGVLAVRGIGIYKNWVHSRNPWSCPCNPRDGGSGKAETRIPTSCPATSAWPYRFDSVPAACQKSLERKI